MHGEVPGEIARNHEFLPQRHTVRLLGHDDDPAYLEAALVALQAVSRASNESLRKLGIPVRHISQ